jgi:hypothetical protein
LILRDIHKTTLAGFFLNTLNHKNSLLQFESRPACKALIIITLFPRDASWVRYK